MNPRHSAILTRVHSQGNVRVPDLARALGVSEMTIRRDLAVMEQAQLLKRVHGGGVRIDTRLNMQPCPAPAPQKTAIGRAAAALVQPGQTVMIDSGTTTLEVARHLPRDAGITLATASLRAAQELQGSGIRVLVLGGYLREDSPAIYGPLTETILRNLHADILFVGCDGASGIDGFYIADLHLASLEQAMMRVADHVVVVTESDKFTRRALSRYAAPEQIHTLITDPRLPGDEQEHLRERGVDVRLIAVE